jgi:hypothetical protein
MDANPFRAPRSQDSRPLVSIRGLISFTDAAKAALQRHAFSFRSPFVAAR